MDEEKRTITTDEAVFQTINILSRIQVPARLVREIGIPISQAISNLEACMEAWAREENEERMKAAQDGKAPEKLFPEEETSETDGEPAAELNQEPVKEAEEDADHGE